jgi:hypothetical protein
MKSRRLNLSNANLLSQHDPSALEIESRVGPVGRFRQSNRLSRAFLGSAAVKLRINAVGEPGTSFTDSKVNAATALLIKRVFPALLQPCRLTNQVLAGVHRKRWDPDWISKTARRDQAKGRMGI